MKRYFTIFVLFLVLIFLINYTNAQPPFQQSNNLIGIDVEVPIIEYHFANKSFEFHLHAHNSSDGLVLKNDTTNCTIHIYKPSDGDHVIEQLMEFNGNDFDFELRVNPGKFEEVGQYAALFYCEVPGERGGFFEHSFYVNRIGSGLKTSESIFYMAVLFTILLLFSMFLTIFILTPFENKKEMTREGPAITKVTKSKYVKIFSFWISYGLFFWFITIVSGMANNYILFVGLKDLINSLLFYLRILSFGINIFFPLLLFWLTWKDIILNKEILKSGKALLNKL